MKKWLVAAATLTLVLAIPAAYAASSSTEKPKPARAAQAQSADKDATKACKADRTTMGVEAFQQRYGTNKNLRNAFGKCVSSKSKGGKDEDDDENETSSGAARACKTERAVKGAEAFAKQYGTNHNLKNAFGKCVSANSKSKSKSKDKDDD